MLMSDHFSQGEDDGQQLLVRFNIIVSLTHNKVLYYTHFQDFGFLCPTPVEQPHVIDD